MIYVMSDIHGNLKAFHSVLEQIQLTENDTLYILGDVIDQHPYGIELLQEIMKMPNAKMLLGDHEYMMLEAADFNKSSDLIRVFEAQDVWYDNYGLETYETLAKLPKSEQKEIFNYLHSLPLNIDIEVNGIKYKLIHGSPLENFKECGSKYESETKFAVWHIWKEGDAIPDGYTLIFGHTTTNKFQRSNPLCIWYGENAIGIDCGSGFPVPPPFYMEKGRLACLRLDDMKEFYSES